MLGGLAEQVVRRAGYPVPTVSRLDEHIRL